MTRWFRPSQRPLKINPEYRGLVPRPTAQEYKALEQDIVEKQCAHTPIIVNTNDVILDGHTRYEICRKHDLWFCLTVRKQETVVAESMFVIESNLHRRHLSRFQRVELALRCKHIIATQARQNQVKAGKNYGNRVSRNQEKQTITPIHTDKRLASLAGVSKDTIYKAQQILRKGNETEVAEARHGAKINTVYNKMKRRLFLEEAHRLGTPEMPPGVYDVVYADPPWRFNYNGSTRGKAENHYATMTTKVIMNLEVPIARDAVLLLWVPNSMIPDGLKVMEAWGFRYLTCFVWVKDRVGMGFYLRNKHETLLLGKRGKIPPPLDDARPPSVIRAPVGRHSEKPVLFYDLIMGMYPGRKYLELFSRTGREGWTSWGLEAK